MISAEDIDFQDESNDVKALDCRTLWAQQRIDPMNFQED